MGIRLDVDLKTTVPIMQPAQKQTQKTTNTQKQNTRTDKTKTYDKKKQCKGSTRTKTLKPEKKHRSADIKISYIRAEFILKK